MSCWRNCIVNECSRAFKWNSPALHDKRACCGKRFDRVMHRNSATHSPSDTPSPGQPAMVVPYAEEVAGNQVARGQPFGAEVVVAASTENPGERCRALSSSCFRLGWLVPEEQMAEAVVFAGLRPLDDIRSRLQAAYWQQNSNDSVPRNPIGMRLSADPAKVGDSGLAAIIERNYVWRACSTGSSSRARL